MQQHTHISSAFAQDLASLTSMTIELGEMAASQFHIVRQALNRFDETALGQLISRDRQLDDLEAAIHEKGFEVIALRGPHADDLRRVLVTLKVATSLERIGDLARNTAKRMLALGAVEQNMLPLDQLDRMGTKVSEMLAEILAIFDRQDGQAALRLRDQDVEVDAWHTVIHREMITAMAEEKQLLTTGVHYLFIAKNIERIGDHITGIAEQVHFLDRGHMPEDDRPKADKASQIADLD